MANDVLDFFLRRPVQEMPGFSEIWKGARRVHHAAGYLAGDILSSSKSNPMYENSGPADEQEQTGGCFKSAVFKSTGV